jgi:hypothetical protein
MSRSLEIEYGNWYTPSEAAPHLPGLKNPKAVREACARDEIEHVAKTGEIDSRTGKPTVRYFISENAIRAYIRRHTKKAA